MSSLSRFEALSMGNCCGPNPAPARSKPGRYPATVAGHSPGGGGGGVCAPGLKTPPLPSSTTPSSSPSPGGGAMACSLAAAIASLSNCSCDVGAARFCRKKLFMPRSEFGERNEYSVVPEGGVDPPAPPPPSPPPPPFPFSANVGTLPLRFQHITQGATLAAFMSVCRQLGHGGVGSAADTSCVCCCCC